MVSILDFLQAIKTIVLKSALCLVTDLLNGVNFLITGYPVWGALCLGLTIVPGIVVGGPMFAQDITRRRHITMLDYAYLDGLYCR